jgi:hypothetical protein
VGAINWDNGAKFMVMADRFGLPLVARATAVSFGPAAFSSCSAQVCEMTCGYRPPQSGFAGASMLLVGQAHPTGSGMCRLSLQITPVALEWALLLEP